MRPKRSETPLAAGVLAFMPLAVVSPHDEGTKSKVDWQNNYATVARKVSTITHKVHFFLSILVASYYFY